MSRHIAIPLFLGAAFTGRLFLSWATGEGLAERALWVPFVYALSVAGLILSSLLVLGSLDVFRKASQARAKGPGSESFGVLAACAWVWVFQFAALATAVLRDPGHALAAEKLHLSTLAGAWLLAALLWEKKGVLRSCRLLALFVFAALPPLPGFFSRIETLSCLVHAGLPRLAALVALSQVVCLVAITQLLFESLLPDLFHRDNAEDPSEKAAQ